MDAKVEKVFIDRHTKKIYSVGEIYTGTAARVTELSKGGYVEARKPAPKPKKTAK